VFAAGAASAQQPVQVNVTLSGDLGNYVDVKIQQQQAQQQQSLRNGTQRAHL
jgi:hypothetical protein